MQFFWETPSWGWSWFWAAVVLLLPTLLSLLAKAFGKNPRPIRDFLNGADGRWSTSKTAFFLWTYALWFAFVSMLIHVREVPGSDELDQEYLLVLGIPAGAAIIAKGVVQSKVDRGDLTKATQADEMDPVAGTGQLFSDDQGRADLLDFQYFGFNLLLLGFFLTKFLDDADAGLPDLPDSLLALTSVGAASYVAKKGLEQDVGPTIRSLVPREGPVSTRVTVNGVNLATASNPHAEVLFGNLQGQNLAIQVMPTHVVVKVDVPPGLQPGEVEVRVIAYDGRQSSTERFTLT